MKDILTSRTNPIFISNMMFSKKEKWKQRFSFHIDSVRENSRNKERRKNKPHQEIHLSRRSLHK